MVPGEAIDGHRSVTRLGGHRADSYKTEAVLLQDAPRWPVPGVGINENADAGIVAADLGHEGGDHLIAVGLVEHAESGPGNPLLYRYREFGTMTHISKGEL